MKKSLLVTMAALVTAGVLVGPIGTTVEAAGSSSTVVPTAKPAATTSPIMRDNLSKYGLVKALELPVTVETGGFSYTLEKVMIYESSSPTAQALIKKYGYYGDRKYFIWTKITIQNKSKSVIQISSKDLNPMWRLNFGEMVSDNMPKKVAKTVNSKEALWAWKLEPGQKLSTYQAYLYNDDFKSFYVSVYNKQNSNFVEIVKKKGK